MSTNIKKWLAERRDRIEEEVGKGKDRKGLAELPDGTYVAVYRVHEFGESKNENVGVKTCWRVLEGEQIGEDIWMWEDLDRDNAFEWLTVRLKNSGTEIEDAQDVYDELKNNPNDLFGYVENKVVVKITLKSSVSKKSGQPYQNKTVLKPLPEFEFDEEILNNNSDSNTTAKEASNDEDEGTHGNDDDGVDLEVGMMIEFKKGKKELKGEIIEIDFDDEVAKVKTEDGTVHEVGLDAIVNLLDDEVV